MQSKRIIVWRTDADPTPRTSYYRADAATWQVMSGLARTARVDQAHIMIVSISDPIEMGEFDLTAAAAEYLDGGSARYVLAALLGIRPEVVDLWANPVADMEPHLVITETPF